MNISHIASKFRPLKSGYSLPSDLNVKKKTTELSRSGKDTVHCYDQEMKLQL